MRIEQRHSGNRRFVQIAIAAVLVAVGGMSILLLGKGQLGMGIAVLALPFALVYLAALMGQPRLGIWSAFVANYFVMGITRYLPGPLGLSVDALLVLAWLAALLGPARAHIQWRNIRNGLSAAALLWFLYAVFELFNPEAVSREAWFYAMRGVSLYMVLTAPLVLAVLHRRADLELMLRLWAWFTLLAVGKGLMQKIIGPDPWEQHWLATVGGKTHLLAQGLRVFSFFTDAATYGGSMGFSGVVFAILALYAPAPGKKIFYGTVAASAFLAMMLSGTRGALAVPFAGFALYAVLSRQVKVMLVGGILMFTLFALLKFTTIGNGVYEIRRFRGGLDKNNDSFQVRLENQRKLSTYLAARPFGGGIGSAGNWGLRFSPNTFLAQTPTDSWYVQIWAEQGRVGLLLHLAILGYLLAHCSYLIMYKLRDPVLKGSAMALLAGIFGIMGASYGSGALGQMPNGIIIYMSLAYIFMMPRWEQDADRQ